MKELKKIIIIIIALSNCFQLCAQFVENNPCTAICLDPSKSTMSGRTPAADGFSPNINLPCGGGTTEDNPLWFTFRPSGSSFFFSFSSSNCSNNMNGLQVTVWEGTSCGAVSALVCMVGTSGNSVIPTTPYSVYYIQFDGVVEAQCDLVISYDKAQLAGNTSISSISGAKQICKNADAQYCAVSSFIASDYKWTLNPSSAGTIAKVSGQPECAKVRISNPPASGKVQVCVEPIFTGKCAVSTRAFCYEVDVIDLKPSTCNVEICPEQQPFTYNLRDCVNANITPSTYTINNLPPGTKKIQTINYALNGASCGSTITLNIQAQAKNAFTLPPTILCEGETKLIKGNLFSCAEASNALKRIIVESTNRPASCDTTFDFLVQCIKISPKISGTGVLDCSTTQLILNAGGGGTIVRPSDIATTVFQGKGNRNYQWSKNGVPIAGATNATLVVTSAGDYTVMLSYTYEITQTINGIQVKTSKTCSKSASVKINGSPGTAVAEMPELTTSICPNKTSIYSVLPDPNAQSYQWTVTGGATIVGSSINPSKLQVKNGTLPYKVCLTKTACNKISTPSCLDVTPSKPLAKPNLSGNKSLCRGDSAIYDIIKTPYDSTVHYSWTVLGGSLSNFNVDSSGVMIKWSKTDTLGKIIIKVNDDCSSAFDTIKVKLKKCDVCGTSDAGKMKLKFIITANNINKTITAKHHTGTETIDVNHTFAFVLHEGSGNKIVNPLATNKTGTFAFNSTKMFCNRIYYVSYIVGKETNGFPSLLDTCLSVVPQGQRITWLCPIKTPTAQARVTPLSQNADYQVNVFPNPAEEQLFIEISNVQNAEFDLYNIQGQLQLSQKETVPYGKSRYEISVAHLPKGIYLLKMKLDDKIEVRKIRVE